MSQSGEYAIDLEAHDTEPCAPPVDPEAHVPTWPRMRAIRIELETDILTSEDLER